MDQNEEARRLLKEIGIITTEERQCVHCGDGPVEPSDRFCRNCGGKNLRFNPAPEELQELDLEQTECNQGHPDYYADRAKNDADARSKGRTPTRITYYCSCCGALLSSADLSPSS